VVGSAESSIATSPPWYAGTHSIAD
jgi:hypothetical protein